jgi:hypothetical protein
VDDLEVIVSEIVLDTVVSKADVVRDAPDAVDSAADEKQRQCVSIIYDHSRPSLKSHRVYVHFKGRYGRDLCVSLTHHRIILMERRKVFE